MAYSAGRNFGLEDVHEYEEELDVNQQFIDIIRYYDGTEDEAQLLNHYIHENDAVDLHYNNEEPFRTAMFCNHFVLAEKIMAAGNINRYSDDFRQVLQELIIQVIDEKTGSTHTLSNILHMFDCSDLINAKMMRLSIDSINPNLPALKLLIETSNKPELVDDHLVAFAILGDNLETVEYLINTSKNSAAFIDDLIDYATQIYRPEIVAFLQRVKNQNGW